jgi:signal transduction histidine kinase
MAAEIKLELPAVLDGLGQGVLIFSSDGKLVQENLAARTQLGNDLTTIRTQGWEAAATLFDARKTDPDSLADAVRERALASERPVRFHIYRSGEYIPCWAGAVQSAGGEVCTMITIDVPDWSAMTALVDDRFRSEMQEAIDATQGHIDLIHKTIKIQKPGTTTEMLAKRITGFTRLISVHMHRVGRLMVMLERLEDIRTGKLRDKLRARRGQITVQRFMEDFVEELDEIMLVDPETEAQDDHRSRITTDVSDELAILASSTHFTQILRDILRNAIMYSMKATPITITARVKPQGVQIDFADQGYGVREKERERVFEAFQRARQPQVFGEFGYGLSLYLCKQEVEAMNGRLWFESEENVGTTFSLLLPEWQEPAEAADSSSDSSDSAKA